jgi:two-component system NarL family sensor kinase
MAPDEAGAARPGRAMVARQVGQFALAGVIALALVGLGTAIAARRVGEREAVTEARATTVARAQGLVTPVLTDGILTGDPDAVARVAAVVEQGVLDRSLVRVKLWTAAGRIVYSDEPRLIGASYQLGADDLASLRSGVIEAEVSDLSPPENRYERSFGRLLEVYLPVYTPSGEPLLFEAYYRYDAVRSSGSRLFRAFAPIAFGALVLLELVQLPLAWSLARRLRQRIREREALLQRTLDASDVERRQIASDLHDGVVQDLAGLAYALSGASRQVASDDPQRAQLLETSAEQVRDNVRALRSLLVEIYPPNLQEEGLEAAVTDLLAAARARGLTTELDASALRVTVPSATAQLLYRATQEALRNVLRHAEAESVAVRLVALDGTGRVEVRDDGRGFEPDEVAGRPAGHFGLRGLEGLVADAGGSMELTSAPGHGTTVVVEVPIS